MRLKTPVPGMSQIAVLLRLLTPPSSLTEVSMEDFVKRLRFFDKRYVTRVFDDLLSENASCGGIFVQDRTRLAQHGLRRKDLRAWPIWD